MSPSSAPKATEEREVDIAAVARHVWARRYRIVLPTMLVAGLTAVGLNFVTPQYTSQARLLIESGQNAYSRPQGQQGPDDDRSIVEPEAIQSQVQVILSRDLVRQVVRQLNLAERPEFATQKSLVAAVLERVGIKPGVSTQGQEERVLEAVYKKLSVFSFDRSRVIAIDVTAQDPELAAAIANALAGDYLTLQQSAKSDATRQATQWLATEIDTLRARLAEAEAKVEDFRARANLYVGANGVTLSSQQLGELNTQLSNARSQKIEAEARAAALRAQLRAGGNVEASEVLNSDLIRRLVEQRILLRAALAEQSSNLLSRHPRIRELRAQIADLDGQIRAEAETMARSLDSDARIAASRVDALNNQLDALKKQATLAGNQDVQLRALEREARAQRDLLEAYLARYRDAASRGDPAAAPPDARIISRASPAFEPSYPKKAPMVLMATFATFFVLTALVALGGILSAPPTGRPGAPAPIPDPADEGKPAHHLPWIGGASANDPSQGPKASSLDGTLADLARLVELRGSAARIVVVTGPAPDEGASRCALALGRALATTERRVVLVCLDAGSPTLSFLTVDPRAAGLTDLLFGVASFSESIHREAASRCHVIPPGRDSGGNVDRLVGADRLALILNALAQTYDHVVVASPPLGGVTGADRLARLSPTVVLVTQPGSPATDAVEAFDALATRGFADIAMVTFRPHIAAPLPQAA
ncbi:MAG TPA: exopolysaccharide transport family protein [Xanthobacteraceae bacterium]|nr:exopolysaccharide transport family protein [Xanthobacteraceae bacterium]